MITAYVAEDTVHHNNVSFFGFFGSVLVIVLANHT
jgi:hypothetical protein